MGDCNFTHGVTHCSATLASLSLPLLEVFLPWCILPFLFVAPSPCCVLLSFVECTSTTIYPRTHFYSSLLFLISHPLLLLSHLLTFALLSRAILCHLSRFVTSGTPHIVKLSTAIRWSGTDQKMDSQMEINVETINDLRWFKTLRNVRQ